MPFTHPLTALVHRAPRAPLRGGGATSGPSSGREDDPWSIPEWEFPADASMRRQLEFLARYAVLAPSGHNRQPWKFRIARDRIDILADRSRSMPTADPRDRELIMSCGAALHHLRVAMTHYGIDPVVRIFPNLHEPDLVASISAGQAVQPGVEEHQLFMAIRHRRTHRAPFIDRPVDETAQRGLSEAVRAELVVPYMIGDDSLKSRVADLVSRGETTLLSNARYVEDISKWISSSGRPNLLGGVLNWRERRARRLSEITRSAPILVILSTPTDTAPAWLATGQAISHILLKAREYGIYASFINQPVVAESLRTDIVAITGGPSYPQIILRMGYGVETPASERSTADRVTFELD